MKHLQGSYYIGTCFDTDRMGCYGCCPKDIVTLMGQQERAGTTNRLHWQFLVHFRTKKTLRQALAFFPPTTHLELVKSEKAKEYVHKDETFVEGTRFIWGKDLVFKKSRDWTGLYNAAVNQQYEEISEKDRFLHAGKIAKVQGLFGKPLRRNGVETYVFFGPTATGKTYRAFQEAGDNCYVKDCSRWWDGYQGETNIIIDEFEGEFPINDLKRILDIYPLRVPIKGGYVCAKWTKIWITSQSHPSQWYPQAPQSDKDALLRRITKMEALREPYNLNIC